MTTLEDRPSEAAADPQPPAPTTEALASESSSANATDDFRPSFAGWAARLIPVAIALFVLFGSVFAVEPFRANEFTGAIVFAIAGISLNVLIGYTGTLSLGHQAFIGIGAFTSAYMVTVHGQSFWIGVLTAAVVGGLQAFLLGLVALRISGLYFALITLSYGILAQESFFGIEALTGGAAGQPAPSPVGDNFRLYYFIALSLLGLVLFIDWQLMRSKTGRALLALRENPKVAQTFSINVSRYTLVGFAISGVFAGIGGAIKAHTDGFVVSNPFDFQFALLLVIVTVVGGLKSRVGIIVSAIIFSQLKFIIETIPGLDAALAKWDQTLPVLIILIAAGVLITQLGGAVEKAHQARKTAAIIAPLGLAVASIAGSASGNVTLFWALLAATGIALGGTLAMANPDTDDIKRERLIVMGFLAAIAVASLLVEVPFLDGQLEKIPVLTPEIARVVLAPAILLVVLTTLPGGLGQIIRPVQHWVLGNRFDWSVGVQEEVAVTDMRA